MNKEIFTTYCPTDFEDIILFAAFRNVSNGYYVDIGANNPVYNSVTKYLYDNKGWHGINIEPLQKEYKLLCEDRHKDINLNFGVSDKKDNILLYINGELSTFVDTGAKKQKLKTEMISVYTLTEILDKYKEFQQDIYFCKIDTEGFENKVLSGIDFNKYRPFLFCIESTYPCTQIPSYQLREDILIKNKYCFIFSYGVNRYYVDVKCKMYNDIKHNLNIDKEARQKTKGTDTPIKKDIKTIFFDKLKIGWHLLPIWIRAIVYKNFTLKLKAKKILSILKLNYNIKVIIK